MKVKMIPLQIHGDERGSLVVFEDNKNIPFDIKRVYYIFDTKPGVVRGKHAHRNLKQIAICLKGSCKFLLDNGKERYEFVLNSPFMGLYMEGLLWREMFDFSEDCVLLVLASDYFNKKDYIRDYDEFLELANSRDNNEAFKQLS